MLVNTNLNKLLDVQVSIVPCGAGREASKQVFTWYPRMPGNSTACPDLKRSLQEGHVEASMWEGACEYLCEVVPLTTLIEREHLPRIDLLKVRKALLGIVNFGIFALMGDTERERGKRERGVGVEIPPVN